MSEKCDKRTLKRKTEAYWRALRNNPRNRAKVWQTRYLPDLLPLEMRYMEREPERLPSKGFCDTLVLLMGHSIEPLLQSIWAYKPQDLLLILNQWYSDTLSGKMFAKVIRDRILPQLPEDCRVEDERIRQAVVEANPVAVFSTLVEEVRGREKVVMDITGAKKSMVAGAFLYAAYADVPVSYVDFDDAMYSTKYGRPYGYASHIRSFENPYTAFALRDWERVRRLCQSYHFREARRLLLEEIVPTMKSSPPKFDQPYFEPQHIAATERLIAILHCYELWDSGDFREAKRRAHVLRDQDGLDFEPPTAIQVLGDTWPYSSDTQSVQGAADLLLARHKRLTTGEGKPADSIFCHADWLIVYAEDELARIKRLIVHNEDYRSALLRAASLNETLLKARWACLWREGEVVAPQGVSLPSFELFTEQAAAGAMLKVFTGQWSEIRLRGGKVALAPGAPALQSFWKGCSLDMNSLIDLRNKTIHTYLSVPRSVADGAADMARRNLEDYREHWATQPLPDVTVHALAWPELCKLCGADAFLPPNLLD